jgi:tetraacyldisaccharide 4'-kinase
MRLILKARLDRILSTAWLQRGWLAWVLWPLSLMYGALVRLRQQGYRLGWFHSDRLPVPVVVVGNLVAGGAGKTPLVIALVQHLQAQGIAVGVISRGYGRRSTSCVRVFAKTPVADVGDEPALIHQRTGAPVVVGHPRILAGKMLLTQMPLTQILVCDDGLQHLALQRDLDIGVFDDRGVGNGFLLPAGPLREAWPRSLDLLLHTGAHPSFAGLTARRSLGATAIRADGSTVLLAELAHAPFPLLLALAAIAQPETFFAMLREQGVPLADTLSLPDHYDFSSHQRILDKRYSLICTEKDAIKLWTIRPDALAVSLVFEPEPAFWAAFDQQIHTLLASYHHVHGHTTS